MEDWIVLIKESGLKQNYIAAHIGVSPSNLSGYIHKRTNIPPEKVIQMKRLLKMAIKLKSKEY